MPGVLMILTAADLDEAGFGPLMCPLNIPQRDGTPMKTPPRWSLAKGKVRFVGEVVAWWWRRRRCRPRTPRKP